ncbi:hypothetical protein PMAYCL1PPCAC_09207, partial [Pristionchus mayeri]
MKRFPTGEKCEMKPGCERYTERAIAPTHYSLDGKVGGARSFEMRNENLSDALFFLKESVGCKTTGL